MMKKVVFLFFFDLMSVYVKKTGLLICKNISEYNTMMTSLIKCVSANVANRTSCHTTDDDVNRDLYFVSIDVLFFFFPLSLYIYQKQ